MSLQKGFVSVLKILLESGSDVASVTNSGKTALYCACEKGHTKSVALLLEFGSDVTQVSAD